MITLDDRDTQGPDSSDPLTLALRRQLDAVVLPPSGVDIRRARLRGRRRMAMRFAATGAATVTAGALVVGAVQLAQGPSTAPADSAAVPVAVAPPATTSPPTAAGPQAGTTFTSVDELMTTIADDAERIAFIQDALVGQRLPTEGLTIDLDVEVTHDGDEFTEPTWRAEVPLSEPGQVLSVLVLSGSVVPRGEEDAWRDCSQAVADRDACSEEVLPGTGRLVTTVSDGRREGDAAGASESAWSETAVLLDGGGEILVAVADTDPAHEDAGRPAQVSEAQQKALALAMIRRP